MAKTVSQKVCGQRLTASALQLTLVITLVVTILLGSLLYLHAFYQKQESDMSRQDRLLELMDSALEIAHSDFLELGDTACTDLMYSGDTIVIRKRSWGMYEQVSTTVKWQGDSIRKAFLLGLETLDSTVLYVADEDRNISVSGNTAITGTAYLPKAGIKPAFVDGDFYEGDERIVRGEQLDSERQLPHIASDLLDKVYPLTTLPISKRLYGSHSFFDETAYLYTSEPIELQGDSIIGNMIVQSDTLIDIKATAFLRDIICLAPVVRIASGFRGRVQVFAQDSIIVGDNVQLDYPSALVLDTRTGPDDRRQISIGRNLVMQGTVLLYETERSRVAHMVEIAENGLLIGDAVVQGMLKYSKPLEVHGAVYCYRFITQTPRSLYENYLIDITLDRNRRSPFMLGSFVWKEASGKQRILSWLD